MNNNIDKKMIKKGMLPYLLLILVMLGVVYLASVYNNTVNIFTYNEFIGYLEDGKVEEIKLTPRDRALTYEVRGKLKGYSSNESFFVRIPLSDSVIKKLISYSEKNNFKFKTYADPSSSSLILVLSNLIPILLVLGVGMFFLNKQMAGNKSSMDFGRSRAKLSSDKNKVTFKDVAGLTEEKEEVRELIDFLKNPKKFQKLGARIPKGVLLMGPPGTGKTLLARAVAGEANVPFYYISGSDFVELFVGIGASRVRDMFQQAKRNAPCLIFIDEIDAVGRQRGTGLGGGHDEREQTLNQLLTEMDGFGENSGIIIIAATNRPDVLDPALLRPGRFDRQVTVSLPDINGRKEILKVHSKNKTLGKGVTLNNLAKRTPGFSGADLENLLNEAALLAVRRNKEVITMSEIDEATDRVLMGPAKVSRKYSEKDRKLVAYHEAGHAVIGLKLANASDVQKVTIIPRGSAGGYNMMVPSEEKLCSTKSDLLEEVTGLLGGRVAEEIIFDEVTTGAENDFSKATKLVRAMVCEYGMSDLGPMQLEQQEGAAFLGRDYNKTRNFSENVAQEIDTEMRKIINECYTNAKKIIKDNKNLLDLIAETLLEYETLTKEQIDYLVDNGHMPEEKQDNTVVTCEYKSESGSSKFSFPIYKNDQRYYFSKGKIISFNNNSIGESIYLKGPGTIKENSRDKLCPSYVVVQRNQDCWLVGLTWCHDKWDAWFYYSKKEAMEQAVNGKSNLWKKNTALLYSTNNSTYANKNQANSSSNNNNPPDLSTGEPTPTNTCEEVLGESVINFLQQLFNYIKILGPILVILFSSIDFTKSILANDDDNMKKTQKKFATRILCAVGLYFLPLLVTFIINLVFGTSGDQVCGIK